MRSLALRSGDGLASGRLISAEATEAPLLVCIHGGGCNSSYFDLRGFSTAERAVERGYSVLLVDRPGHGGNPAIPGSRPVQDMVPIIGRFIGEVHGGQASGAKSVLMIGHSIGGAVALSLANDRQSWPLRAVAVSGIGDMPTQEVQDWGSAPDTQLFATAETAARILFGPEGTYSWRAPIALRKSSELWRMEEVLEIIDQWPPRFADIAAGVTVPVHFRLAEYERFWQASADVIDRIRHSFGNAPDVDADLLREGGHIYELHKRGFELVRSQLDFFAKY